MEPLHEDALRLADDVPAQEGLLEAFNLVGELLDQLGRVVLLLLVPHPTPVRPQSRAPVSSSVPMASGRHAPRPLPLQGYATPARVSRGDNGRCQPPASPVMQPGG